MGTGHDHVGRSASRRRLLLALILSASFVVLEVVGGVLSGSLALLADGAHLFMDSGALLLAYAAMTLAAREATNRHTFGLYRAEILAAFVNAEILLLLCAGLMYGAWQRFQSPSEVETSIMLGVAIAGLGVNLVAAWLLHGFRDESLNVRAAYLEVVTDSMSSVGVIAAALVMPRTGWYWLDPALSVAIALLILPRAFSILRATIHILLEGTPGHLDLDSLRDLMLGVHGVEEVHDLHVWTLTSGVHSMSAHIRASTGRSRDEVLRAVREALRMENGIEHATIQVEAQDEESCEVEELHR